MAGQIQEWRAPEHVLVKYERDPELYHHRWVLRRESGRKYWVASPDRDVFLMDLSVPPLREMVGFTGRRCPRGISRKDCYLDVHASLGAFMEQEFQNLVSRTITKPERRINAKKAEAAPVLPLQPSGDQAPGSDREDEPEVTPRESGEKDDVWIVVVPAPGEFIGDQVSLPASGTKTLGALTLYQRRGETGCARRVKVEEAPLVAGKLKEWYRPREPPPDESASGKNPVSADVLENHQGAPESRRRTSAGAAAGADEPDAGDGGMADDLRILPVHYESGAERWRNLEDTLPLLTEEEFEDWPIEGPRTMLYNVKTLRKRSQSWMQQHEAWLTRSGIRHSDRSVHEHRTLSRALEYMTCYDQLNVASLASAEVLVRRKALIEQAHSGRPDAPSYEGAEHFEGVAGSADGAIIDPALTKHVASRLGSQADIKKQTRKFYEERNKALERGGGKGDGKGGRGDGGRGGGGRGAGGRGGHKGGGGTGDGAGQPPDGS